MKITLDSVMLKNKLQVIQGLVNDKTMSILDHCIFSCNGRNELLATDLTTSIREQVDVISVDEKGVISLPRKKLYEIASQLEGEVKLESLDNHSVEVISGKSKFKIAGIDPSEYPTLPSLSNEVSIVLDAQKVINMIERTIFCAEASGTKETLRSVLFHLKPKKGVMQVVGTDGHRMAIVKASIESNHDTELKLIIPKTSAMRIKQFLGAEDENSRVIMSIANNMLKIAAGGREIIIRLLEGKYPPYENIIKDIKNDKIVVIPKDKIISSLKKTLVISKELSNTVKMELKKGSLTISSLRKNVEDIGEVNDELDVTYDDSDVTIYLNGRYLLEALATIENDAMFYLKDDKSIALVREVGNADYLYVVMPIKP